MTTAFYALIATAALVALGWLAIRAAVRSARDAGAAEERASATDLAREAEQEMAEIMLSPTSPEATKEKLRKGEF